MTVKKTIPNLTPGTYGFTFTATGDGNAVGKPSAVFTYTVTSDSTPPPVPSKPQVLSVFGGVVVTWTDPGYQVPVDFDRVDVYYSENSSAYVKFGSIFAVNGTATFSKAVAGRNYAFKFVALDNSGNGSAFSEASDSVQSLPIDIDSTPPLEVSSITTAWEGTTLAVQFNKNASTDATSYIVSLTNSGTTATFALQATSGTTQRFTLTESEAVAAFGQFKTSYTGLIKSNDKLNNSSAGVAFTTATYNDTINNASIADNTWNVTPANSGYIVSFTINDSNFYEAEVWESSSQSGTYSLVGAGRSPIVVSVSGLTTRYVKIRYAGKASGSYSQYSTVKQVVPADVVQFDDVAPANTVSNTGFTITAGIDPNGKYQFAGYLDLVWQAITGDSTIRGYRIRYRKASSTDAYTYADVPGATSSSFRLDGLLIGGSYEVGISPYDELDNVNSTYKTYPNTTITGTASLTQGAIITAGDMEFGYGVKDSTGTTTGQEKGLWLDADDYWYIKSGQSSRFSVGSAGNKLLWDGTDLSLTGKIYAQGGSIDGNLDVISGTIRARTSGTSTAKVEINSSGIQATSDGSTNTVTISSTDGTITANAGSIGGWTLATDALYKPLAGLYAPSSPTSADIAFWAGSSLANRSTADFRVRYDGEVNASKLKISGGTIDLGASSPNGFHVSTTGALTTTGATIYGSLNVDSPSTFSSNVTISGSGELKVGTATDYVKIGSTGLVGVGGGTVKSQITTSGYLESTFGAIGGWSISSGGISTTGTGANAASSVRLNRWVNSSSNIIEVTNASGVPTFKVNGNGDVEVRGTITILDSGGNTQSYLTSGDVGPTGATVISGARITTGTMSGDRITGGTITGTTISGGEFTLKNNSATNYWDPTSFVAGTNSTYLRVYTGTGTDTITMYSRNTQSGESDLDTSSGSSTSSISIPQQLIVDQNSIRIQGLPGVGNGLTAVGSLLNEFGTGASSEWTTRYISGVYANNLGISPYKQSIAAAEPSRTYGRAARYRMIVADPYDYNTLKRGFGVYYGSRTSAPGASNGFVGDIWISW